ncbi:MULTISPECIES: type IV pilus modification protein PilV [Variovorax]|uniref:Type IV pilus modification protein PilV n=1 Tax=Variovorax paradoxus TaxID=34073 RepID=A0A5Q0MFF8_VARPD|nr:MULTISPECIES: type IV pilus modification protein PilV [Variovorax]QFZ87152.1 type IV pilus modification protein PilV [Variovorax paradoxus]WPG39219.1 type IV pilus modification protein PilV [Variovorax boronicumulans]
MSPRRSSNRRLHVAAPQHGIALIEVLVSLVILLFGLLGLVGVSSRSSLAEMESYQRIQALQLVQDMADRLNANRKVASCYSNDATGVQLGTGTGNTGAPSCTIGNAQQQARATADLAAWDNMLKGQAEIQSGANLGAMIGAIGCVTLDDAADNVYMIAVSWQGLAKTAAPTLADGSTAFPCGNGSYGDEKLHRVVTTKVRMGALS